MANCDCQECPTHGPVISRAGVDTLSPTRDRAVERALIDRVAELVTENNQMRTDMARLIATADEQWAELVRLRDENTRLQEAAK